MLAALKSVEGDQPINKAVCEHGIPRFSSTVFKYGLGPGLLPWVILPPSVLPELRDFLKSYAQLGYGKTRKDAMGIAESVAVDKGVLRGTKISERWWQRFLERQPRLTLWCGDSAAHVQMGAVNQETMKQYFPLLWEVLVEYNLMDKPSQIYNVDVSRVPLNISLQYNY